jgi:hypothetical protein
MIINVMKDIESAILVNAFQENGGVITLTTVLIIQTNSTALLIKDTVMSMNFYAIMDSVYQMIIAVTCLTISGRDAQINQI